MEAALDGALHVFRERGYHAASLADLGSAMNLTPGSIYKAFSDKRAIFLAAFDRYVDLRNAALRPLLEAETTGHDKIAAMLRFYAESSCGDEGRRGCLVAGSAMGLASYDADMALRVVTALQHVEAGVRGLLLLGQADGSVSRDIDADAMTQTLLALLQGFRVVGKLGRDPAQMIAAAEQALRLLR